MLLLQSKNCEVDAFLVSHSRIKEPPFPKFDDLAIKNLDLMLMPKLETVGAPLMLNF